jgi:hypothetical protein
MSLKDHPGSGSGKEEIEHASCPKHRMMHQRATSNGPALAEIFF